MLPWSPTPVEESPMANKARPYSPNIKPTQLGWFRTAHQCPKHDKPLFFRALSRTHPAREMLCPECPNGPVFGEETKDPSHAIDPT